MAEAPVYIMVNLVVNNADEYRRYEKGFFPLLKRYDGNFFTYDDHPEHLEGVSPRTGRVILFGFPSESLARQWWEDPEYQKLSAHRRAGCEMQFITLVHGLAPRS